MMTLFDIQLYSTLQGKSNEWYTPSRYIEAARKVMGSIDLDPASCWGANQTVKADRYYTQVENGLEQPWYGNVWCNPPYALSKDLRGLYKSSMEEFSNKLLVEYRNGHITNAIFLAIARTDRPWFQSLWLYPICFADHPVTFIGKRVNPKRALQHMFCTCFVYLGPHEQKFINVFSQFGRIARAIDTPPSRPVAPSLWEVQAP